MLEVGGFDWDDGNWPKCGKHGVGKGEIEFVLKGTVSVMPDRHPTNPEARYNAVGLNRSGRHVFIVFTLRSRRGTMLIRPISARYMHRKEIDSYEGTKGA